MKQNIFRGLISLVALISVSVFINLVYNEKIEQSGEASIKKSKIKREVDKKLKTFFTPFRPEVLSGAREIIIYPDTTNVSAIYGDIAIASGDAPVKMALKVLVITDFDQRQYALDAVFSVWAKNDTFAAMRWINENLTGIDKDAALHSLYRHAIPLNPEGMITFVNRYPDGPLKLSLMNSLGMSLFEKDPELAISWTSENLGSVQRNALYETFGREMIKEKKLEDAQEYIDLLPFGSNRDNLLQSLSAALASASSADALVWLSKLDATDYNRAAPTMLGEWAKSDPQGSAKFALTMSGRVRESSLEAIFDQWARSSPIDAMEFARNLRPIDKSKSIAAVFEAWSFEKPQEASSHLNSFDDLDNYDSLVTATVTNWTRKDPSSAARFVEDLDESRKMDVVPIVVAMWSTYDSMEVSKWITKMPSGAVKDAAMSQLVYSVVESDPGNALDWALAIDSQITRDNSLAGMFKILMHRDPEMARVIATSGRLEDGDLRTVENIIFK